MRVRNWDVALILWAETVRGLPFQWGATDCGSLVRDAMEVMYGRDLWPDVPRWDTLRAAVQIQGTTGGVAAQLALLGAVEVEYGYVQQGDVILLPCAEGDSIPSVGIRVSDRWLGSEDGGVVTLGRWEPLPEGSTLLRMPHG